MLIVTLLEALELGLIYSILAWEYFYLSEHLIHLI